MYQYVVSKDMVPPFSLYLPHPQSPLVLSSESVVPYGDALVIVELENHCYDHNVLDLFLSNTEVTVLLSFIA